MLKIIKLFNRPTLSKNNNSKSIFKKNNGNSKINKFGVNNKDIKYVNKSRKLKSKKLFKSQNLAKLEKKLLKIRNYLILILKKLN